MDRSLFVRALALTIGVAGSLSSLADSAWAGQCDNCDSPTSTSCQCAPGRGLLDTLNDVACKVVKDKPKRKSILHAFKFKSHGSSSCDNSCGCEPSCGMEPTCGTESCSCKTGCGAEPSCGVEPGCGVEPSCGAEPKCGVEASCGIEARSNYTHATGPIEYPRQMHTPVRTENRKMQAPVQAPAHPSPAPAIPAPVPQDSTIDPFRDDTVSRAKPRIRSASQRISSQVATPPTEKTLHFDPQAATRSGLAGPQRAIVRKPTPAPSSLSARGRIVDEFQAEPKPELTVASSRKADRSLSPSVVPASATEPAKLPPLKQSPEQLDLLDSSNPLRDR